MNTWPGIKRRVAQSEFEKPCVCLSQLEKRRSRDRWCDRYMRTRCEAAEKFGVEKRMARHRMPTALATSERVCVKQYRRAPTKD
eukprot:6172428-Pleurochrysis_carterae.AAC.8